MTRKLMKPLPFEEWPERDQARWALANDADSLAPGGGGGGAHWRSSTRKIVLDQYGRWLTWLKEEILLDPRQEPHARATRDRVRLYLDAMEIRGASDHSRAGALQGLGDALRVMCPEEHLSYIGRAAGRISAGAQRANDPRERLRAPHEVLALASKLLEAGTSTALPPLRRSIAYRDGLLLSLWTHRPLRIANLAQIEIDRHMDCRRRPCRLSFSGAEMKAGRPWSCAWPRSLEQSLDIYLSIHRPVLLGVQEPSSSALWISQFGCAMSSQSVAQIIQLRTRACFGKSINPHLMRHIIATGMADHAPEHSIDVAVILSHASTEVSERHYILARGNAAARRYQDVVFPGAEKDRRFAL